jgi:membrane-bound metal-dependent hydrolase YbcI (DUF457 family)
MPVVGHAFVGIVTAHEFEPGGRRNRQRVSPLAGALWTPAVVAFAYLPDVFTQLGLWAGYDTAKLAGHSILFVLIVGVLVGTLWARWSGGSTRVLIALAIGSILFHDLLDLLQSTDRAPFWPLSGRIISPGWLALPDRLTGELLIFGLPCVAYEGWRLHVRRGSSPEHHRPSRFRWAGRVLVITLLVSAVAAQRVRAGHERRVRVAERLLRSGKLMEALSAADAADRWPLSAGIGRTDVVRGEAYERLGDIVRAEVFYLRAVRRDPENFWALADLAEFYASHGVAAQRRKRVAPYVEELRRRFSAHRSFRAVMDRIDRYVAKAS